MIDIVEQLRAPMNALQFDDVTEEAAQEIEKLREIILRQDNELSNLRQRNSDLRERNTRLLSQIQEMEAREQ